MIITLIIGLIICFWGVTIHILDIKSKKWSETIGTITNSELKEKISTDSDRRAEIHYKADLEYMYYSNGKNEIVGKQLFPYSDMWSPYKKEKLAIIKKLKKGEKVKVYYHPEKPSKSCLITGANYYTKYIISGGLVFIALALVIWIYELSQDMTIVLDQVMAQ